MVGSYSLHFFQIKMNFFISSKCLSRCFPKWSTRAQRGIGAFILTVTIITLIKVHDEGSMTWLMRAMEAIFFSINTHYLYCFKHFRIREETLLVCKLEFLSISSFLNFVSVLHWVYYVLLICLVICKEIKS